MQIIRAAERFRTEREGIVSWSCFSVGPNYDPERLGAGPLVGFDEHLLAPCAGFAEHAHRGVTIVSYVLCGELSHRGDEQLSVGPGELLTQDCGGGIRHSEANASTENPLRLLQMTTLSGRARMTIEHGEIGHGAGLVHVVEGAAVFDGGRLEPGDTVVAPPPLTITGTALVWRW